MSRAATSRPMHRTLAEGAAAVGRVLDSDTERQDLRTRCAILATAAGEEIVRFADVGNDGVAIERFADLLREAVLQKRRLQEVANIFPTRGHA